MPNEIFQAAAKQVTDLSSADLVELMKLLMLAEARLADIPLQAATVAMQLTVPDGGEDGRVDWIGGTAKTNYFPNRFVLFQSKAQKLTAARMRDEVLVKKTPRREKKKKGKGRSKPKLKPAIKEALQRKGAYIVFCSHPCGPKKLKSLREAVSQGISKGSGNPRRLSAIEIYDANKIADWVNAHPAVGLWLAAKDRRRSLAGFQTIDSWAKSPEIKSGPWMQGQAARFTGMNVPPTPGAPGQPQSQTWTFDKAAEQMGDRLGKDRQCIRIVGPSGYGKTRFVFEVLNRTSTLADRANRSSVLYVDYTIVGDEVLKIASEIAERGASIILVVDECPDALHTKLASIGQRADSKLRIISLDVETNVVQAENTLAIRLEAASDELIDDIAKSVQPKLKDADASVIRELAVGFPQMAVLAAKNEGNRRDTFNSVEQLLNRIIWGRNPINDSASRALEVLSLFSWVAISGKFSGQAGEIASQLCGLTTDEFVEHVKRFKARGVVVQRGSFVQVQPSPLAAKLAARRWSLLPDGKMFQFFINASKELKAVAAVKSIFIGT